MMTLSTPQRLANSEGTENLFLLVADGAGNPIGLVPMMLLERITPMDLPDRVIDGEARHPGTAKALRAHRPLHTAETLRPHVESALRRLHDPMYLRVHPLAALRVACASRRCRSKAPAFARGKAVSALLCDLVEQLRPVGPTPSRAVIPGREWHAYLILRLAYVEGEHNTAIMSWLQISEGTFNRTRRHALHTLSHILAEMERTAR